MALSKRNTDIAAQRRRLDEINTTIMSKLDQVRQHAEKPLEEVAELLAEVKREKLYRLTHRTFEAYCQETFGHGRAWGYELVRRQEEMYSLNTSRLPSSNALRAAKRANPNAHRAEPRYAKSDDPGFGDPSDGYSQEIDPDAREYVPAVVTGASTERRVVMTESGWGDPEEQASSGQDIDSTITRLADAIDRRLASLPQAEAAVQARILRDRFSEWVAD